MVPVLLLLLRSVGHVFSSKRVKIRGVRQNKGVCYICFVARRTKGKKANVEGIRRFISKISTGYFYAYTARAGTIFVYTSLLVGTFKQNDFPLGNESY